MQTRPVTIDLPPLKPPIRAEITPRPTRAWVWQAATGTALTGLLGLHLIANHFVVSGGLRGFSDVVAYLRNPLILTLEVLFVVVVVTHAMLGVRAVLLDLGLSRRLEILVNRGLAVVGIATVGYAFWLTWMVIR